MTKKLFIQAVTKFIFGILLVGLLIFLPAGTISYENEWLFMGILFIPMFLAGFIVAGLGIRFDWYMLPKEVAMGAGK